MSKEVANLPSLPMRPNASTFTSLVPNSSLYSPSTFITLSERSPSFTSLPTSDSLSKKEYSSSQMPSSSIVTFILTGSPFSLYTDTNMMSEVNIICWPFNLNSPRSMPRTVCGKLLKGIYLPSSALNTNTSSAFVMPANSRSIMAFAVTLLLNDLSFESAIFISAVFIISFMASSLMPNFPASILKPEINALTPFISLALKPAFILPSKLFWKLWLRPEETSSI